MHMNKKYYSIMNMNKSQNSISKTEIRRLHCWETRYDVNSEMMCVHTN